MPHLWLTWVAHQPRPQAFLLRKGEGRCHSVMGVPLPKTLVLWASPSDILDFSIYVNAPCLAALFGSANFIGNLFLFLSLIFIYCYWFIIVSLSIQRIVQSVIQPLGCNGFLIKLSIYLCIYLSITLAIWVRVTRDVHITIGSLGMGMPISLWQREGKGPGDEVGMRKGRKEGENGLISHISFP